MTVALDFDTKLFCNKQPGGVFNIRDASTNPGKVFWVGSNITGASDSAGYGQNPSAPFATLVYAETQTLASRGDTIYILPGHTETLLSATGAAVLTLDVANLRIVGMGRSTKPAFLIDGHANNYVSVTGADTVIENCTFKAGAADVAAGMIVAAAGVAILGCDFIDNTAGENFVFSIKTTAAADSMYVEGCRFISIDAAADAGIHIVGACNDVVIKDNFFQAPYVTSAIEAITNACLNILIENNKIHAENDGNDLAAAVDLVASSTGMIVNNRIFHSDTTDCLTSIDGGNCGKCGNLASNEFAEEGGVAATQSA